MASKLVKPNIGEDGNNGWVSESIVHGMTDLPNKSQQSTEVNPIGSLLESRLIPGKDADPGSPDSHGCTYPSTMYSSLPFKGGAEEELLMMMTNDY